MNKEIEQFVLQCSPRVISYITRIKYFASTEEFFSLLNEYKDQVFWQSDTKYDVILTNDCICIMSTRCTDIRDIHILAFNENKLMYHMIANDIDNIEGMLGQREEFMAYIRGIESTGSGGYYHYFKP